MSKLIEAVVIGNKCYNGYNPDTETHFAAQQGDKVMVTPTQLKAFPERLMLPQLAEAHADAAKATAIADQALEDAIKESEAPPLTQSELNAAMAGDGDGDEDPDVGESPKSGVPTSKPPEG